jgi:hypothetical protein
VIEKQDLSATARALPIEERKGIIVSFPETELHVYLAELFRLMIPSAWVEVTHSGNEYGKDLVIVRNDPFTPDVIGVVVKRGDIRGKTSGEVDELKSAIVETLNAKGERITAEILSQIAQAKHHEAVLHGFVRKLQVTRVIVIIAGEVSRNAQHRIEREVGPLGQVYDLPWLVEHFTTHYPQVFYEGRTIDVLDGLIRRLEHDSFHAKTGKSLSECFVEPVIAPLSRTVTLDEASLAVHLEQKRVRFSELRKLLDRGKKLLIVGEPGSGKSKLAAKLCIDDYRSAVRDATRDPGHSHAPYKISLLVGARHLAELETAEQLLAEHLPSELNDRFTFAVLVIDGIDEVSAEQRDATLAKGVRFAVQLGATVLVTSRPIPAFDVTPEGFDRFELLPLEYGQAIKLMQKAAENPELLPALREGLNSIHEQIPMNPLSLLLLVEVVVERKEVPSSITELYDRFLDLVFGRWEQDKGVEVLFEYIIKKKFLAAVSYHLFRQQNRLEVPRTEFDNFVAEYAVKYGWNGESLNRFLQETVWSSPRERSHGVGWES